MNLNKLLPLSGAEIDTLRCLFARGPTQDGDLPSKSGRDALIDRGFAERGDGWNWITRDGVHMAIGMEFDRKKEKDQRQRRLPS